jgi:polyisoprenoid-binding protein YceI
MMASITGKTQKALLHAALGALLPAGLATAATTYDIDPNHTYPSFEADHMGGVSVWRGKFNKSSGTVVLDRKTGTGDVDVAIDTSSIDFGLEDLNKWATAPEFFDAARYPRIAYKGKLEGKDGVPSKVVGELTLHGVTRPVELQIVSFKCIPHPVNKRELCGADARGTFKRDEFGLAAGKDFGFNMDVALRIQVEAIAAEKQPAVDAKAAR